MILSRIAGKADICRQSRDISRRWARISAAKARRAPNGAEAAFAAFPSSV